MKNIFSGQEKFFYSGLLVLLLLLLIFSIVFVRTVNLRIGYQLTGLYTELVSKENILEELRSDYEELTSYKRLIEVGEGLGFVTPEQGFGFIETIEPDKENMNNDNMNNDSNDNSGNSDSSPAEANESDSETQSDNETPETESNE